MEFSLAYLTVIGASPFRMLEIAAAAGYDCVGMRFNPVAPGETVVPFLDDPSLVEEFNLRRDDLGLGVLDAELIRVGPDGDPDDYRRFMEVAREMGARHLVVQLPDPDRARAADRLARIAELAAAHDMTADLEFIPWTPTADLQAAIDLVEGAGHPNAGILVDTLHFERSDSTVEQILDVSPDRFRLIQLCDAPFESPLTEDVMIATARGGRSLPGEGDIDLVPVLSALPSVPCSLEVPNDALRGDLGDEEFARRVLEASRRLLERVDAGRHAAQR